MRTPDGAGQAVGRLGKDVPKRIGGQGVICPTGGAAGRIAMAVAELRLLGSFELRMSGGEVVDLLGQKDRALLANSGAAGRRHPFP